MKNLLSGVFGGDLVHGGPLHKPVQRGDHRGAVASGMVGGALQRMSQQFPRSLRLRNQPIQLGNLLANGLAPLRTRGVEDSSSGIQRQPHVVRDLEEREAT